MSAIDCLFRQAKKVYEQNAREKVLAGEKQSVATMSVSPLVAKRVKSSSSSPDTEQTTKPVRRVLPEHEGKYKITLPSGSTERSKQILARKASRKWLYRAHANFALLTALVAVEGNGEKKGVFDRLEKEPKIKLSGIAKPISSSIFSRLGGKSSSEDILEEASSSFAGILKKNEAKVSDPNRSRTEPELKSSSSADWWSKKSGKAAEGRLGAQDPREGRNNGRRRV